jgi:plasmid stabilization system protein ParE
LSHSVRFTREAEQDLLELYELMAQRDVGLFPFSCRKAQGHDDPLLREMLITFGSTGYVAFFEIEDTKTVTVVAVRHQRESDYR